MKAQTHLNAVRTSSALTPIAENIMTYTLEGLIHEVEPLFTAVYLSSPDEALRLRHMYPDSEEIRYIVSEVFVYHTNMAVLARGVANGFFEYEVDYLLKIAKENRVAAARFIPIFCTALEHAEELGLSNDLQEKLKQHIDHQKDLDGFVIVYATKENLVLRFAKDVVPK